MFLQEGFYSETTRLGQGFAETTTFKLMKHSQCRDNHDLVQGLNLACQAPGLERVHSGGQGRQAYNSKRLKF
ncbi:hypothetical protein K439DRAFT_1641115 [Ramaria rubella]|nr:hypothetical protein K439DRAFT_1641115 [Ramaria rubella]